MRNQLLIDSQLRWNLFHSGLAGVGWEGSIELHRRAESEKLIFPSPPLVGILREPALDSHPGIGTRREPVINVEYFLTEGTRLHLAGYAFHLNREETDWHGEYQLILKSDHDRYVIPLQPRFRPDVTSHLRAHSLVSGRRNFDHSGFAGFLSTAAMNSGQYQLYLSLKNGNSSTYWPAGKTVTLN